MDAPEAQGVPTGASLSSLNPLVFQEDQDSTLHSQNVLAGRSISFGPSKANRDGDHQGW